MIKSAIGLVGFLLCSAAYSSDYKCHSFCGTPMIFAEMNILTSGHTPQLFSTGKSVEEAFENLQKSCAKTNKTGVPLRFLHAPTLPTTK